VRYGSTIAESDSSRTCRPGRRSLPRVRPWRYASWSSSCSLCALRSTSFAPSASSLLLPLQQPCQRADQLLPDRTFPPLREGNLARIADVGVEVAGQPFGNLRIADRDVHLVVVLERPVVEVR